jgi:hypothetical protein
MLHAPTFASPPRTRARLPRLAGIALCACLVACGLPIGDIDRTQPNKIRKSVFVGDWYFAQTVIGAPYTTTFTFIGETTERTERVTWDIQQDFLIAYRSYDLVAGTDAASELPGDHSENTPVAIFPIVSHFDVQREYNPSTGEQTNVISENTWDRPWYEREWMRVDWSQNLAANFNFLVEEVSQVPGSHYVQSPGDPDALLFGVKRDGGWEDHQGDSIATLTSADYFDVVHRIFASPETIFIEDWDGTVYEEPACWYYTTSDCASAEITIRSSFLKAPTEEADTYVPKDYPDNAIQRDDDGNPIRVNYTGEDVMSLAPDPDGFIARAGYFDKFGFFRTERERYDRRFGETETGRIYLINRFDIWEDEKGCVTDAPVATHANCTVKPIEYWLSRGFPEELREIAQAMADEYNQTFKQVVWQRKYGGAGSLDDVEDVVILHDNTFAATSDGNVTDRGQRMGDLRYNLIGWVDHANYAGLLGYGPAQTDPLTGRIIQASAYTYGAGVDLYAQEGKTIIDLINNPELLADITNGADVSQQVYLRAVTDPHPRQKTLNFVRQKVNTPRRQQILQQGLRAIERDRSWMRARTQPIVDTPLEQRLMTDPILRAFGQEAFIPGAEPSEAARRRAKPSSWMMGRAFRQEKERMRRLQKRNIMHTRAFDASVVGLAERLRDLPSEELFQRLRAEVFRSTTLHELGHNFGLRHNFEGSTDALNYHREYWDLKGEGAQALEAPDDDQIAGGLRELQYSSIMDYASRFSADLRGLGHYDRAAIAFGYGDLVEVFEGGEPDEPLLDTYDLDTVLRHWRHYTKLPEIFGGIDAMYARRFVPHEELIGQIRGDTSWSLWEVPYRFCSDEYDGYNATCSSFDEGADPYEIVENARRQYLSYFPLLSFQRDRRFFDEYTYMATVQWRAWYPMLVQYQNWVFDSYFWEFDWQDFRDNYDLDYYRIEDVPWSEAADGGLSGAAGSRLLLDTIAEVIAMPEPGSYAYDTLEEIHLLYSYGEEDDAELIVPFGQGRYTDSLWDVDSGYYFYDRLTMVGSFYDKLLALETAVTSDTYFLGVDAGADVNQYAIGLSLMFPEEIYRLVGGSSTEDYPAFSGQLCADGTYAPPTFSAPEACPGAGPYVDPGTSFTIELFSIFYGIAYLPLHFDLNYHDRIHIWINGGSDGIEVSDPAYVVTFVNPLNNRTYLTTTTGVAGAYHPGAAMLQRAQRFADAYTADPTLTNRYYLEAIELTVEDIRGTYQLYGQFVF